MFPISPFNRGIVLIQFRPVLFSGSPPGGIHAKLHVRRFFRSRTLKSCTFMHICGLCHRHEILLKFEYLRFCFIFCLFAKTTIRQVEKCVASRLKNAWRNSVARSVCTSCVICWPESWQIVYIHRGNRQRSWYCLTEPQSKEIAWVNSDYKTSVWKFLSTLKYNAHARCHVRVHMYWRNLC